MLFRSREQLLPIPAGWEHDYWCLLVAAGIGSAINVLPRPLARYRQHSGQVIGGKRTILQRWEFAERQSLESRSREAERWGLLRDRLAGRGGKAEAIALVEAKRAHLLRRSRFPRARGLRLAFVFMEWLRGGYGRYDAGLSSAVKDILSS